jgi:cytochrome P450
LKNEGVEQVPKLIAGKRCPVAFDHHSEAYAQDWIGMLRSVRQNCPVAWSEAYGGFWLLTRYEDVLKVARDDHRFSQAKHHDANGNAIDGALVPSFGPVSVPFELDPPEHGNYRALFMPLLSRAAVSKLEPRIRALVAEAIDEIIEAGRGDLMLDVAEIVPAYLICELLGFDRTEAHRICDIAHKVVYIAPGSPDFAEVVTGMTWLDRRIDELMDERRRERRDDVISYFVHARVDGEQVSARRASQMIGQFIFGGVDTTGSFVSTALVYLHDHLEDRKWLCEDLSRVPAAVEELLRYFTTAQHAARTVLEPVEIGGQLMARGDRVMMSWAAANHDPEKYDRPDEVILDRKPGFHFAFGVGAHTCMGMHLGRLQARIIIAEILKRMPDYRLMPGGAERYPSVGVINGWVRIPVTFSPGKRS